MKTKVEEESNNVNLNMTTDYRRRAKGLRRIGVTEEDVMVAENLISQSHPCYTSSKLEKVLGYSNGRIRRAKALRLLGVDEEDIDEENSKVLSALGKCGRKRSIRRTHDQSFKLRTKFNSSNLKRTRGIRYEVSRKIAKIIN